MSSIAIPQSLGVRYGVRIRSGAPRIPILCVEFHALRNCGIYIYANCTHKIHGIASCKSMELRTVHKISYVNPWNANHMYKSVIIVTSGHLTISGQF